MLNSNKTTIKIKPGLILIKNALTNENQIQFAKWSKDWYLKLKTTTKSRDRSYDSILNFSNNRDLLDLCKEILQEANKCDSSNILMDLPTHLLFLRYKNTKGMGYHKDNGENDGKGINPVISLSLGNSCKFNVKLENEEIKELILESGDVLLFGGVSRFITHSVSKIINDCPNYLENYLKDERINLTFRYAPEILGREKEFETFNPYQKN